MIHPATAHFAMVLPVVASAFGLIYLVKKDQLFSKITARLTLLAAIAMAAVWYTGTGAGPQIFDYLSPEGKTTLIAHKNLGLNLAIIMGIIALLQIVGCKLQKRAVQLIATLALFVATGTTFYQGKMGGELVYNHGAPFKSFMIMQSINEAVDAADEMEEDEEKVEAYEDAIDNIKMVDEEVNALYGIKLSESEQEDEE